MSAAATATLTKILKGNLTRLRNDAFRTLAQFAEAEIIIPDGRYKGQRFSFDRQPFVRSLYDEIDSGRWTEFTITGPSQSGKSLCGWVIIAMYHLFEMCETVILGLPDMDMASDKWAKDLKPAIEASRYAQFLPVTGPGSKGGRKVESIDFTNGATLKFMSGGGGDKSRAGFTARVLIVTETDGMDSAGEASREADKVTQMQARQRSFPRHRRRTYMECTVSTKDGRTWRDYVSGSETQIWILCPKCKHYVHPGRGNLVGWDDAESEEAASRAAAFSCPACGELWSDKEHRQANFAQKLVHKGQRIQDNQVVGDRPVTSRLGFRWDAVNNLFLGAADHAVDEWRAAQLQEDSPERENAEKELCQFIWAVPYIPKQLDASPLTAGQVEKRATSWRPNVLPDDTSFVTVGGDIGRYRCWYMVLAFRTNGGIHVVDYGHRDTSLSRGSGEVDPMHERLAIRECLDELTADLDSGWVVAGTGDKMRPSATFNDSGYCPDAVFAWANGQRREAEQRRHFPILGRGKSQRDARIYTKPSKTGTEVRKVGLGWHLSYVPTRKGWQITVDADQAKLDVQNGLRCEAGTPGAISLAEGIDHSKLAKHLSSEVRRRVVDPIKGVVDEWIRTGPNHLLDCAAYALVAGRYMGYDIQPVAMEPPVTTESKPPKKASWRDRARERRGAV